MTQNSSPSQESVLQALRKVNDPDLQRDLVTLGMIRDLQILADGKVSLRVVLTTPACPLKAKIEAEVRAAVLGVPGVRSVEIQMDSEVRKRAPNGAAPGPGMQSIEGVSHIIAVSSGKGGVGKSTVAVNLAMALAQAGARVGLLDSDVYGPNVPTMMGVTEQPKVQQHPQKGEIMVPPSAHGIRVMSMGFLIQGDQPMIWRGPMLHSVVNQFCHKVFWGELDYLVVDMPPGTGDVQLSLAQLVPVTGAVLVTTPQEISQQDVRKAFHMFEKVRIPVLGVVENMSYFRCDQCDKRHSIFGSEGGKTLARRFNTELLAQIPIVPEVREGGDTGRPVVLQKEGEAGYEAAQAFRALAGKVAQKVSILDAQNEGGAHAGIQIGKFS